MKRIDGHFSTDYIFADDMDVGMRDSMRKRLNDHLADRYGNNTINAAIWENVHWKLESIMRGLREMLGPTWREE